MESELNQHSKFIENNTLAERVDDALDEWSMESVLNSPDCSVEDAIHRERLVIRLAKWYAERAVGMRVYNYFRIVLSFLFAFIFYNFPDQTFVGALDPNWFQATMFTYLVSNIVFGIAMLVSRNAILTGTTVIFSVAILDILFLSVLLLTSGGISSGLGYLLLFAVSFGSVMISSKNSFIFPAIATATCVAVELNLHISGIVDGSQHFFQVAILSSSFFFVTFFFQFISNKLTKTELEVVGLETLNQVRQIAERAKNELEISNSRFSVLLTSTAEGVLGLDMTGRVTSPIPELASYLISNTNVSSTVTYSGLWFR